jgi:predicted nucleic-acid-binding protein
MIGLDTNILLRYIVQDDPIQSGIATTFIETHCTAKTPGFVCNIVLVELVWVLEGGYGYDKNSIITVLKIERLMHKYADLPMDLADASLVILAEKLGHGRILSTDQRDFKTYRWKNHKPFQNLLLPE